VAQVLKDLLGWRLLGKLPNRPCKATKEIQMKTIRIDYQDKIIYLGIDVHKRTYSVTVICEGQIIKRDTITANPAVLVAYLRRCFPGARIHSVYEAGFSGFALHRVLVQNGVENIVVNPASIEVAANDKVKTDRRDSRKLAEQLFARRLKAIYVPEPEQELRRQLTRTREQIVRQRARLVHQIKSKLHYFGVPGDALPDRNVTERHLKQLEGLSLGEELIFALKLLIAQWRFLTLQLREMGRKLHAQARGDTTLEPTYRSAPGIGPIGARTLANELGNPAQRFHNERELFKFTGLTPPEHSSGESVRRGHISRQGAARIRHVLVEAAWRAIRVDPALRIAFERLAARCGKKRAIVAMARKLIGRLRACFKTGTLYECGVCQ
jgi:transposase